MFPSALRQGKPFPRAARCSQRRTSQGSRTQLVSSIAAPDFYLNTDEYLNERMCRAARSRAANWAISPLIPEAYLYLITHKNSGFRQ